ncbi:hypothetical protein GGX14DRAFT_404305 [Mycena pura]|uniref:Uncharacterized protein n=1 Tax=Mycena pura TaxID=153505 RepID=A0AAD6Y7L8_9AGAR|nr:hypothetical protein GGX14DRAFT_404305 [Mycena pura]
MPTCCLSALAGQRFILDNHIGSFGSIVVRVDPRCWTLGSSTARTLRSPVTVGTRSSIAPGSSISTPPRTSALPRARIKVVQHARRSRSPRSSPSAAPGTGAAWGPAAPTPGPSSAVAHLTKKRCAATVGWCTAASADLQMPVGPGFVMGVGVGSAAVLGDAGCGQRVRLDVRCFFRFFRLPPSLLPSEPASVAVLPCRRWTSARGALGWRRRGAHTSRCICAMIIAAMVPLSTPKTSSACLRLVFVALDYGVRDSAYGNILITIEWCPGLEDTI